MVPFDQLVHGLADEVTLPGHADLISGMLNAVGDNDKGRFGKDFPPNLGYQFQITALVHVEKIFSSHGCRDFFLEGQLDHLKGSWKKGDVWNNHVFFQ